MVMLADWMLKDQRQYVIDSIKAPLLSAIVKYCLRYPEPTHENCNNLNSHFLIDLRDEFLRRETNLGRRKLFQALWRCFIGEYEHDVSKTRSLDWIFLKLHEAILSRKVKLNPPDEHTIYWNKD